MCALIGHISWVIITDLLIHRCRIPIHLRAPEVKCQVRIWHDNLSTYFSTSCFHIFNIDLGLLEKDTYIFCGSKVKVSNWTLSTHWLWHDYLNSFQCVAFVFIYRFRMARERYPYIFGSNFDLLTPSIGIFLSQILHLCINTSAISKVMLSYLMHSFVVARHVSSYKTQKKTRSRWQAPPPGPAWLVSILVIVYLYTDSINTALDQLIKRCYMFYNVEINKS